RPSTTPRRSLLHATDPPDIYTLSLHDALPISAAAPMPLPAAVTIATLSSAIFPPIRAARNCRIHRYRTSLHVYKGSVQNCVAHRSEEHTSELQSRENLVCRLLLEKKKYTNRY